MVGHVTQGSTNKWNRSDMKKISFYTFWQIRSQVLLFIGAVGSSASIFVPSLRNCEYSNALDYGGLFFLIIGFLDSSTLLQRSKILKAIKEKKQSENSWWIDRGTKCAPLFKLWKSIISRRPSMLRLVALYAIDHSRVVCGLTRRSTSLLSVAGRCAIKPRRAG